MLKYKENLLTKNKKQKGNFPPISDYSAEITFFLVILAVKYFLVLRYYPKKPYSDVNGCSLPL